MNPEWKEKSPLSEELYYLIEAMKTDDRGYPLGYQATQWIHLQDAVDKGTISPLEAYDAVKLGYLPEHLTVRESRYKHLLRF